MTREELEKKAFDILSLSMEYNGEDEEIWKETKATDSKTLLNFIKEHE